MTTALTLTAALTVITASAASAEHGPDLSSTSAIESYLVSIGVDPAEAVWQEGLLNYAGPSCPGIGWNCVPSDVPIVQIAAPLGTNVFECTGLDCVAVQIALGAGQNDADCDRGDWQADTAIQICEISQTNTTGNNVAGINQSIQQKGAEVTARQVARIMQTNESGRNSASFHQVVLQSSQVTGIDLQSQDAFQAATLEQSSVTGANFSNVDQRQTQSQRASGSTDIEQDQNNAPGSDELLCDRPVDDPAFDQEKNQCTQVTQHSGVINPGDPTAFPPVLPTLAAGGGRNSSNLSQIINERQTATKAGNADQEQGNTLGGQEGTKVQLSSGLSEGEAIQRMTQAQTARGVTNVNQDQDTGDPRCCWVQTGNDANRADIAQTTDQTASSDDADQDAMLVATCLLFSGTCHVEQSATTDDDSASQSEDCTAPGPCTETIICFGGEGEGECFTDDEG